MAHHISLLGIWRKQNLPIFSCRRLPRKACIRTENLQRQEKFLNNSRKHLILDIDKLTLFELFHPFVSRNAFVFVLYICLSKNEANDFRAPATWKVVQLVISHAAFESPPVNDLFKRLLNKTFCMSMSSSLGLYSARVHDYRV